MIKKAQQFQKTSKNPHIVRGFLRLSKAGKGPCFIASAVFEDEPWAWELYVLRKFRDERLKKSPFGRRLVKLYYSQAPWWSEKIRRSVWSRRILKPAITAAAKMLRSRE